MPFSSDRSVFKNNLYHSVPEGVDVKGPIKRNLDTTVRLTLADLAQDHSQKPF
jgi:hypothetical protein